MPVLKFPFRLHLPLREGVCEITNNKCQSNYWEPLFSQVLAKKSSCFSNLSSSKQWLLDCEETTLLSTRLVSHEKSV